jgi:hypothetical protein
MAVEFINLAAVTGMTPFLLLKEISFSSPELAGETNSRTSEGLLSLPCLHM